MITCAFSPLSEMQQIRDGEWGLLTVLQKITEKMTMKTIESVVQPIALVNAINMPCTGKVTRKRVMIVGRVR